MRLIDADALIEKFLRYSVVLRYSSDFVAVNLDAVIREVSNAPAIEVEPVKHGKYITDWLGDVSCSLCGEKWLDITQNYCPNCGAKMTEGE